MKTRRYLVLASAAHFSHLREFPRGIADSNHGILVNLPFCGADYFITRSNVVYLVLMFAWFIMSMISVRALPARGCDSQWTHFVLPQLPQALSHYRSMCTWVAHLMFFDTGLFQNLVVIWCALFASTPAPTSMTCCSNFP
jgi:hypothetical protein